MGSISGPLISGTSHMAEGAFFGYIRSFGRSKWSSLQAASGTERRKILQKGFTRRHSSRNPSRVDLFSFEEKTNVRSTRHMNRCTHRRLFS